MHKAKLLDTGDSVVLVVPPAILERLSLRAGEEVSLAVDGSRLIVESAAAPHYSLEELLAQCDDSAAMSEEDQAWLVGKAVGNELL
jgi:antitoxin ChpS